MKIIDKFELFLSKVSGLTGEGLDEFLNVLTENVKNLCETKSGQNCPGLTRERHKIHLSKAIGELYLSARWRLWNTSTKVK